MTRTRHLATRWTGWAWLPLAVAVIAVEGLILMGVLSVGWTGFVIGGALVLTNGSRGSKLGKRLQAKAFSR